MIIVYEVEEIKDLGGGTPCYHDCYAHSDAGSDYRC